MFTIIRVVLSGFALLALGACDGVYTETHTEIRVYGPPSHHYVAPQTRELSAVEFNRNPRISRNNTKKAGRYFDEDALCKDFGQYELCVRRRYVKFVDSYSCYTPSRNYLIPSGKPVLICDGYESYRPYRLRPY